MYVNIEYLLTGFTNILENFFPYYIFLTIKRTGWNMFKNTLKEAVTLLVKLRTSIDIEVAVQQLTNKVISVIKMATPEVLECGIHKITFPFEIKELLQQKGKIRKIWHRT